MIFDTMHTSRSSELTRSACEPPHGIDRYGVVVVVTGSVLVTDVVGSGNGNGLA
jgi:hypothetical protein